MKFNKGKFKILIFADIHDGGKTVRQTYRHLDMALKKTQPDLVVLLGDNVSSGGAAAIERINKNIDRLGGFFEERKIPFALVFGNHDHEGLRSAGLEEREAKKYILERFSRFSCCLAAAGEEMTGVGNYNIPLYSSDKNEIVANLWFMDSNAYEKQGGYGRVHSDQLCWYEKKAEQLRREKGETVPSYSFQHIIIPEVYEAFERHGSRKKNCVRGHGRFSEGYYCLKGEYKGALREGPCPPDAKSSQLESWLRTGDIVAAFFGHDHINDFELKLKGIDIVQVPSAGYSNYGNRQGSKLITISEQSPVSYSSELIRAEELEGCRPLNPLLRHYGYERYKRIRATVLLLLGASTASALVINKIRK